MIPGTTPSNYLRHRHRFSYMIFHLIPFHTKTKRNPRYVKECEKFVDTNLEQEASLC